MSQPVIEACLRIPTFVLANRGWDRALAREAFWNDLPAVVAQRRSKGTLEDHYEAILRQNRALIRSLLLDGQLVEHGLLSRNILDEVLSDTPTKLKGAAAEIHAYLGIEAWATRWKQFENQDATQRDLAFERSAVIKH